MAAGALLPGTSIKQGKIDLFPNTGSQRPPGMVTGFNRRIARGSFSRTTFEVQGLNTLIEHWYTVAALTDALTPVIVDFYSDVTIHNARQFVPKDTWATHDSINKEPGVVRSAMGDYSAWIGPTTFYSRFLEFGTIKMSPLPFMIPAIDMVEPDFIKAFEQVAKLADHVGGPINLGTASGDPRARGVVQQYRGGLYSLSKFLGDVAVFGGRQVLSPIRANAIQLARLLGDVQSVMSGTLGGRISRRLRGRATGRIRGYGSATLTYAKVYSAFPGGEGGHRVYNRFMGRISTNVVNFPIGNF